jgi:transposase
VKNDLCDASDLADLLRMGRLPEAWIAPPQVRELGQLVRHRAKLVAVRSGWKCQVHAVLAACGVPLRISDRFGQAGTQLLDHLQLPTTFAARVDSLGRLLHGLDAEIDLVGGMARAWLARRPGDRAIQAIDGVGPVLAAVLVAEIGEVTRLPGPAQLASWVGLTPRHRESDSHVHRGRITKQGSRLARWAAVEAVQRVGSHTRLGQVRDRVAERRDRNIGVVAAARELVCLVSYGLRDGPSAAWQHEPHKATVGAGRAGHHPQRHWRGRPELWSKVVDEPLA